MALHDVACAEQSISPGASNIKEITSDMTPLGERRSLRWKLVFFSSSAVKILVTLKDYLSKRRQEEKELPANEALDLEATLTKSALREITLSIQC